MLGLRKLLAEEACALGGGLRVRDHALHTRQRQFGGRDNAVMDRMDHLGGDAHVLRLEHQRVERHADAALERVLDRDDGRVHGAVLDGHHGVVDRRVGDLLAAGRSGRAQRLLAVGPRGTEVRDAHQAPVGVPAIASSTACCSSGESSYSGLPSRTCFT